MPSKATNTPKAAFVEDCDSDTEEPVTSSRVNAVVDTAKGSSNPAKPDAAWPEAFSDSGYSSSTTPRAPERVGQWICETQGLTAAVDGLDLGCRSPSSTVRGQKRGPAPRLHIPTAPPSRPPQHHCHPHCSCRAYASRPSPAWNGPLSPLSPAYSSPSHSAGPYSSFPSSPGYVTHPPPVAAMARTRPHGYQPGQPVAWGYTHSATPLSPTHSAYAPPSYRPDYYGYAQPGAPSTYSYATYPPTRPQLSQRSTVAVVPHTAAPVYAAGPPPSSYKHTSPTISRPSSNRRHSDTLAVDRERMPPPQRRHKDKAKSTDIIVPVGRRGIDDRSASSNDSRTQQRLQEAGDYIDSAIDRAHHEGGSSGPSSRRQSLSQHSDRSQPRSRGESQSGSSSYVSRSSHRHSSSQVVQIQPGASDIRVQAGGCTITIGAIKNDQTRGQSSTRSDRSGSRRHTASTSGGSRSAGHGEDEDLDDEELQREPTERRSKD